MMRRILLGATVLAGLTSVAFDGQAVAQAVAATSPFSVRITGFSQHSLVVLGVNRASGTRSHDLWSDSEVQVTVTGKADNGLTYGFRAEFEADATETNNIDENSIFFQGSWGRIEIGQQDAPNDLEPHLPSRACRTNGSDCVGRDDVLAIRAASAKRVAATGGAAIPGGFNFGRAQLLDSSDAGKIIYESPRFNGFFFNAAYAPSVGAGSEGQNFAFSENANDRRDAIEVGAGYEGKFGNVDFLVRLAYNYIKVEDRGVDNFEDISSFGGVVRVGVGGFAIGVVAGYDGDGGYRSTSATNRFDDSQWFVSGRAEYTFGAFTVGIGAQYATSEGDQTRDDDQELWAVGLQGSYTLAPGLQLLAEIAYVDFQNDVVATSINRDLESTAFTLTTRIRF